VTPASTASRLVPDADEAAVVVEIFHLHAARGWSPQAIANHLNRLGGHHHPSTSTRPATVAATGQAPPPVNAA
jgi:hypothetical protein